MTTGDCDYWSCSDAEEETSSDEEAEQELCEHSTRARG